MSKGAHASSGGLGWLSGLPGLENHHQLPVRVSPVDAIPFVLLYRITGDPPPAERTDDEVLALKLFLSSMLHGALVGAGSPYGGSFFTFVASSDR
jgi:hypothetical protein